MAQLKHRSHSAAITLFYKAPPQKIATPASGGWTCGTTSG